MGKDWKGRPLDRQGFLFGSLLGLRRAAGPAPSQPCSLHTDVVPPLTATRNHSAPDTAFRDRA